MATFVRDLMTGTGYANLDIGHTAEAGGPWVRNPGTPDTRWYLFGDRCHCGVKGAVYASGTPSSADYYVECDYIIYSDIQGPGIALRMSTSAVTCYSVRYTGGQYVLSKWVAGVETWIGTQYVVDHVGQTHKLKLTATGTSIVVAIDGVNVITATDSSIPAAGKAGLYSPFGANDVGSGKHVDNFVAVDGAAAGGARSSILGIIG